MINNIDTFGTGISLIMLSVEILFEKKSTQFVGSYPYMMSPENLLSISATIKSGYATCHF